MEGKMKEIKDTNLKKPPLYLLKMKLKCGKKLKKFVKHNKLDTLLLIKKI